MPSATQSVPVEGEMAPEELKTFLAEIGTTPENLKKDSVALREWVNSQPHLPDITSEHDEWLETFLVVAKNSMEKAKSRLDNYFTTHTVLADWFVMPPAPEDALIINETEYMLNGFLPRVLPGGYIVYIDKPVLPAEGSWTNMDMKLHCHRVVLHLDAMMARSKKIRGMIYVMDEKNACLSMVTTLLATIGTLRKTMSCVQDCLPLRLNSIHMVNPIAPSMQKVVINAITPLLKGKLAERIKIHDDMKSLHDHIPPAYLPKEYGGTAAHSLEDMTTTLSNFIESNREWFSSRTWMKTNEDRRLEKKVIGNDMGVEGSFRKLSVD